MILIADSGSTKTSWRALHTDGQISQIESQGSNPYFQTQAQLVESFTSEVASKLSSPPIEIHFYGAGCGAKANRDIMEKALRQSFPSGEVISVNDDMLAASRALAGHEPGICCILGTGANSCLYNGQEIDWSVPSLGFLLGDEGSGAYLGKILLAAHLRNELPESLANKLDKRFDVSVSTVLKQVYQEKNPNRYLATFSKFIFQNIKEPFLYKMVYSGFEQFFDNYVLKYPYKELPVHFTGSVAFYFSNILRQVANDKGVVLKNVLESPIAGLTLYHQNN